MVPQQRHSTALSAREEEIIELSIEGLTNDAIAHRLGISVGTVNTYWMRIRLKVGGAGRTDTVAKILADRAEKNLQEVNLRHEQQLSQLGENQGNVENSTVVALLRIVASISDSLVWAVDKNLDLCTVELDLIVCEEEDRHKKRPSIQEFFSDKHSRTLAVQAHQAAVSGTEGLVRLGGELKDMVLRTIPLRNDMSDIIGCIGILGRA